MRKLLLSVGAVVAAMSINAQAPYAIPNAGFETWTDNYTAASWAGYNNIAALYGIPSGMLYTFQKDMTNKNSGTASIKIQNVNNTTFGADFEGIAWLGTAGTSTANAGIYGIPFSQNLNAFGGYFRYAITAPGGKDTAIIICQTTKWNGSSTDLIDDASIIVSNNTSGFQNFTQPAMNVTPGVPDTLWIVAFSSFWPTADSITAASSGYTSILNMDDLTLTVVTGVTAPVLNFVDTRVAPNPANDVVRFTTSALNIGGHFKLFDITGKLVLTVPVTSALDNRFNVESLPSGVYFYQVSNSAGEINANGKLVVTH